VACQTQKEGPACRPDVLSGSHAGRDDQRNSELDARLRDLLRDEIGLGKRSVGGRGIGLGRRLCRGSSRK